MSRKHSFVRGFGKMRRGSRGTRRDGSWGGLAPGASALTCLLLAPSFMRRCDPGAPIKFPPYAPQEADYWWGYKERKKFSQASMPGWSLAYITKDKRLLRIKDLQS